jgi:hypothetical protein
MILKFKFKPEYWERAGYGGANLFIKSLPPKVGYQNYGIGELPPATPGSNNVIITNKLLTYLISRKQVIILEEYIEDDTDTQQEGLFNSGDS